jgi:hypothetical protein
MIVRILPNRAGEINTDLPGGGVAANPQSNERGRDMPTDLERYGHWQDGLILIALIALGTVITYWLWGG